MSVDGGDGRPRAVEGPDGTETYQVPLPAVVTIREGGVEPRYPTVPGRMKAKKVAIEERTAVAPSRPVRSGSGCCCRRRCRAHVQILGKGPEAAPAVVDLLRAAGGAGPMILTLVEKNLDGAAVEVSLEALTFARDLSAAGGGVPVDAVVVGEVARRAAQGARGVRRPRPCTSVGGEAVVVLLRRGLGLGDPHRRASRRSRSS